MRYLFGNPGSSEEGLLDEITRFPDIEYVMGLQEAALVCMADGYAQATGAPSVVLLHSGVGLGNAVGSLYHALHRQTPMVVMAGEAGVAYDALEAHMSVNLVDIARPVTKYATRAIHPASLVRLLRRCTKIASTPPRGPVFLAVPQDVLDQLNDEPVVPTVVPDTRVVPDPGAVEAAARLLAGARSPVILAGDGVAASGAVDELVRFAQTWGVRRLGRDGVRTRHAVDASAVRRAHRPHVRHGQRGDRRPGRRGGGVRHVPVPGRVPRDRATRSARTRRSCTSTSTPTRSPRTTR